jgi:uncharacterized protein YjdB
MFALSRRRRNFMIKRKLFKRTAAIVLSAAVMSTGVPTSAFASEEASVEFVEADSEEPQEATVEFVEVAEEPAEAVAVSEAAQDVDASEDLFAEEAVLDFVDLDTEKPVAAAETEEDAEADFAEEDSDFAAETSITNVEYVLMNIPYADFYKAEVNNSVAVDGFTSATKAKTLTGSLAGGSYHVSSSGEDITGVIYPVKITEGVDLSAYKQVTDDDKVEITTTNRGQTSTATYVGKEALFENPSYSYYILSEAPAYYKEATMENGTITFGKAVGAVTTINDASARLITDTTYGDYQLNILGADALENTTVNAIVIGTKEGSSYGLRHVENIWLKTQLAWSVGFTTSVHNCPTSSAHYVSMMGQTINKVTYYTTDGIYEIPLSEILVPTKFAGTVSVTDANTADGKTTVTVTGLPSDFKAVYSVSGLTDAKVEGEVLTYSSSAQPGSYTLAVEDQNGKYVGLTGTFVLSTSDMPAAYDVAKKALKAADGFTADQLTAYISKISSVSVNGTDYSASGRGAVVIINEDGSIKTDADPIKESGEYTLVVKATGYPDLTFTYTDKVEVSLDKTTATIYVGGSPATTTLKATVTNSDAAVTYKSSDTAVATVSSAGVVTAKKAGTATITATCGTATATCKVTVKAPTVKLNKTTATIYVGGSPASFTLKATLTGINKTVTYKSSNTAVATVSSAGVVTAKKAGTATITATCGTAKATCKVTVKAPSITLSKKTATIYTKGTTKVTLTVKKTGINKTVTYKSSNTKVATVSSKGVVTAKKTGTVTITATCGTAKATCKVTVKAPSLKLSKTSASITKGKTVTIKATATPSGTITYKSSNTKIATVSSKGVVKGIKKGTATITVTCNGVSQKFKVTVK